MNIIDLKPIGKVILNEHTPQRIQRLEHYLIPYYQRGYRWDEENVLALLEDVHNFMRSDERKYCLQPIVVVPVKDSEGYVVWEVIDGQQRLITLYIIFSYLGKPKYQIIFEKRNKSNEFLASLNPEHYSDENPDFHFMSKAYQVTKEWFDNKTQNDIGYIDEFNTTLTKKVELIWYQVEELNKIADADEAEGRKIDIFNRLNIGKIPLTDAELIRALLLSKIKYGLSEREATLRQSEVSAEWHRIEQELRNEQFWYFLNNKPLEETSSTIEFIFKLIAKDTPKKYSTYLWFEKEIKSTDPETEQQKASNLWMKTKEYFGKLKYWYEDNSLYHHLGFKLALEGNPLSAVKHFINNAACSKSAFRSWAVTQVKQKMAEINLDDLSYEKDHTTLKQVFLLHNITLAMGSKGIYNNRFPFDQYKKVEIDGGWSIEHIHAQLSKEMKEELAIRKWLKETYESVKELKETDIEEKPGAESQLPDIAELKAKIEFMLKAGKVDTTAFNELKLQIIQKFDSPSVHVLDNLALLASKHNSALNNAIFAVKRNRIIAIDKENQFIPPATRNVFLKYYSISDLQPFYWSKADKENYINDIKSRLMPYLNIN